MSDPAWYPDPMGGPALRWWDGTTWTGQVWPPVAITVDHRDDVPAGWYDDDSHPGTLRWWDGRRWTERFARIELPRGPAADIGRGRPTTIAVVAVAGALLLGVALVVLS